MTRPLTLTHGMADVPPHAAHVPRMLLERIARDPESVGRPHTFTIDAAVVAVDICGYVPMTDWAMRGVLRRERSVKRPHSLRASFSSSSSFDAFEGGDPDRRGRGRGGSSRDPGDEREGRRSSDASGSDLCLGVAGLTGEEARNVVTACFTKAIREIHERGGDVLKFAGDALFAAWTASDDVSLGTCVAHAARCASAIHATVSKVGDSNTDNSSSVRLKVCVGAGELHAFNVGGVGGKWEFMCAGEPLAQIAKLMPLATPGQTLVSERAHSIIQSQSTGAHLRTAPAATGGHRLVIDRPRTDSDGIEHDIEHDIEDMIPPTSTPEAIVRLHAPNECECDKINGVAPSRRGGYRRVRPPPRRGRSGGHHAPLARRDTAVLRRVRVLRGRQLRTPGRASAAAKSRDDDATSAASRRGGFASDARGREGQRARRRVRPRRRSIESECHVCVRCDTRGDGDETRVAGRWVGNKMR